MHPLWQAVMEDVPPLPTFLYFPLLARKGARGMVRTDEARKEGQP